MKGMPGFLQERVLLHVGGPAGVGVRGRTARRRVVANVSSLQSLQFGTVDTMGEDLEHADVTEYERDRVAAELLTATRRGSRPKGSSTPATDASPRSRHRQRWSLVGGELRTHALAPPQGPIGERDPRGAGEDADEPGSVEPLDGPHRKDLLKKPSLDQRVGAGALARRDSAASGQRQSIETREQIRAFNSVAAQQHDGRPSFMRNRGSSAAAAERARSKEIPSEFEQKIRMALYDDHDSPGQEGSPLEAAGRSLVKSQAHGSNDGGPPKSALLVDDDPVARKRIEVLLRKSAQIEDIVLASNGVEATRKFCTRGQQFDVVVCDLNMGGNGLRDPLNGPFAMNQMRQYEKAHPELYPHPTPIILLSATSKLSEAHRAFYRAAGADDLESKPPGAAFIKKVKDMVAKVSTGPANNWREAASRVVKHELSQVVAVLKMATRELDRDEQQPAPKEGHQNMGRRLSVQDTRHAAILEHTFASHKASGLPRVVARRLSSQIGLPLSHVHQMFHVHNRGRAGGEHPGNSEDGTLQGQRSLATDAPPWATSAGEPRSGAKAFQTKQSAHGIDEVASPASSRDGDSPFNFSVAQNVQALSA